MTLLFLRLAVLLLAARAGTAVAHKLNLPSAVGALLAGMALGPCMLALVQASELASGHAWVLLPSDALHEVAGVAGFLLLLRLGMDTDLRELRRFPPVAAWTGISVALLTGTAGAMAGLLIRRSVPALVTAPGAWALLGVVAMGSTAGLGERILGAHARLNSPEGRVALGALVWLRLLSLATLLATLGYVGTAPLALLLGGAFVAGTVLARPAMENHTQTLRPLIQDVLLPPFYALLGLLVARPLAEQPVVILATAGVVTLAALAATLAGACIPALLTGFNRIGMARIACALLPRGPVALLACALGAALGLFPPPLLSSLLLAILATGALAARPLVRLYATGQPGLRHPPTPLRETHLSVDTPPAFDSALIVDRIARILRSDGCSVRPLVSDLSVLQFRGEDGRLIGLVRTDRSIVFDCQHEDLPLVRLILDSVLADLEKSAHDLRRTLGAAVAVLRQPPAPPTPADWAALRERLVPRALVPNLRGRSRMEIVEELAGTLERERRLRGMHTACHAVDIHEESPSAGSPAHSVIAHGRTDGVRQLVCAFGIKPEGIEGSAPNAPSPRVFALVLAPPRGPDSGYLGFLGTLARILDGSTVTALTACRTAEEMLRVLSGPGVTAPSPASLPPAPTPGNGEPARTVSAPASVARVTLTRVLNEKLVKPCLTGGTRDEVIRELVDLAAAAGKLQDPDAAYADLLARERQTPTGLEHGIAVPHVRSESAHGLVCALGTKPDGVDFSAFDGQPSRIILLIVSSRSAPATHVQLMAHISRLFDEPARAAILAAETPRDLWHTLTSLEKQFRL